MKLLPRRYHPSFIRLEAEIADHIPPLTLAKEYRRCLQEAGLGEIKRYSISGMRGEDVPGSQEDLEGNMTTFGSSKARYFAMVTKDKTRLEFFSRFRWQPNLAHRRPLSIRNGA